MKLFWDLKTQFRKSLSIKNKVILVLEAVQEEEDGNWSKAFEKVVESSPVYKEKLKELSKDYSDLPTE
jgi:hypothetical protein